MNYLSHFSEHKSRALPAPRLSGGWICSISSCYIKVIAVSGKTVMNILSSLNETCCDIRSGESSAHKNRAGGCRIKDAGKARLRCFGHVQRDSGCTGQRISNAELQWRTCRAAGEDMQSCRGG